MTELQIPTETLGDRMRRARVHAGVSVQGMADELEISRQMISRWEAGKLAPRRAIVLAYAMRCQVPVEWLVTGATTHGYATDPWSWGVAA